MVIASNKIKFLVIFSYFALLLIYMVFLPFGDEPDFARVAPKYIDFLNLFQISYFDGSIEIIDNLDPQGQYGFETYAVSSCKYVTNPYQIFGAYDLGSCLQNINLAFKRFVLTFLIYLPIILFAFYKNKTYKVQNLISLNDYSISKESYQLCFLFPGFIYYSSVFSIEQITLMLSMLFIFFLFQAKYIFAIVLFSILYLLDTGNAIVVLGVSCYVIGSLIIYRKLSFAWFILLNFSLVILVYFLSTDLLFILEPLHPYISLKIEQLEVAQALSADISNKYPLWSRPFMTFLSYNFMAPAMSKHLLLYAVVSFGISYTIYKHFILKALNSVDLQYIASLLAVFSFISMMAFVLPGHVNAKYYIFTLPFIVNLFNYYYSYKALVKFFLMLNIIVLLEYLLFYTIGCEDKACFSFFGTPF
jgi:hypothetical protein